MPNLGELKMLIEPSSAFSETYTILDNPSEMANFLSAMKISSWQPLNNTILMQFYDKLCIRTSSDMCRVHTSKTGTFWPPPLSAQPLTCFTVSSSTCWSVMGSSILNSFLQQPWMNFALILQSMWLTQMIGAYYPMWKGTQPPACCCPCPHYSPVLPPLLIPSCHVTLSSETTLFHYILTIGMTPLAPP